jgi:hypothetical protein
MSFNKKKALHYIEQVNRRNCLEFERRFPKIASSIEEAARACIENYWYINAGVRHIIDTDDDLKPEEIDRYIMALGFKVTSPTEKELSEKEEYKFEYTIRFNIF